MTERHEAQIPLPGDVAVVNIGLPLFADAVRDQATPVQQVDWRIPADGRADLVDDLELLYGPGASDIDAANAEVLRRLDESVPLLVGVEAASEVVPGLADRTLLHCGPEIEWADVCDPLRRSMRAAVVADGWARNVREANRLLSDGTASGIRIPLAIGWRGAIVAVLAADQREWQRLQEAVGTVLGASTDSWTAIAVRADGVPAIAGGLAELHEGLRVAEDIGRRGVIDDLAELGIERLLLSDPELASVIVERELGALLADARMGDELVETLQVFFDAGENRRETARRLHLADRTVAYRLERAVDLLGHGLDGEPGRRLNLALTLRRLEATRRGDAR